MGMSSLHPFIEGRDKSKLAKNELSYLSEWLYSYLYEIETAYRTGGE